tara:strand:+ start:204426 stop:204749 length:324 start_codon:yes stop_codon:yes gene_type:complete
MTMPGMVPLPQLITFRDDTDEQHITDADLFAAQYRWQFRQLENLSIERRKDLCKLLLKQVKQRKLDKGKMANSSALFLWQKVADDPSWPDRLMNPDQMDEPSDNEEG